MVTANEDAPESFQVPQPEPEQLVEVIQAQFLKSSPGFRDEALDGYGLVT